METFLSSIDWRDIGAAVAVIVVMMIMLYSRRDDAKARQESDRLQAGLWEKNIIALNEGFKTASSTVAETIKSMTVAYSETIRSLKDFQSEQRVFYMAKLDETREEVHAMEKRILELEDEVKDKDRRIEELERENLDLKDQVRRLTTKVDNSEKRQKKKAVGK